jgi:hypothetical protein
MGSLFLAALAQSASMMTIGTDVSKIGFANTRPSNVRIINWVNRPKVPSRRYGKR